MATFVVVGLGNIGSHLVSHLARMPDVTALNLVDPDHYDETNLVSQEILARDVGAPKVAVQARRLRRLRRSLDVRALRKRVQEVPVGHLRADAILSCLDTLEARRWVNQAAWRLGIPWIDAGVRADGLLARVTPYRPGRCAPCIECSWGDAEYAALEVAYPCTRPAQAATGAPSSLGALAASLQAIECRKLLDGRLSTGRSVLFDAAHGNYLVTRHDFNPACRFDHRTWRIEPASVASRPRGRVEVEERPFATRLQCPSCDAAKTTLRLLDRITPARRACGACGATMNVPGFHLSSGVELDGRRTLRSVGLRSGDVCALVQGDARAHYELA
jgi:molybdopterin/thiamine biosynthesis adenylyltransferase